MAVDPSMFLFEILIGAVENKLQTSNFVIRSEFDSVFALELKDPKSMKIAMPEPPPPPPEPPGKKKKKKNKPKPKKKKKGKQKPPPPEPEILNGKSVLYASTIEHLIEIMPKTPVIFTMWSGEDYEKCVGSLCVAWDPKFINYLKGFLKDEDSGPVTVQDDYNLFEENTAKIVAKVNITIKLTCLKNKITACFRSLTEDLSDRKYLYTGMNNRNTSFMCTLLTPEEKYLKNAHDANYVVDKPKKIEYATYGNHPAANLTFFNEKDYCCMKNADHPPDDIYKSPETMPDIDFIVDYVRKVIVSCNDQMRRLTPRPTIYPRVKATDLERFCYCQENDWPEGDLAARFKKEVQGGPCALCETVGGLPAGSRGTTYDIANIRGPCGQPDCRIARRIREYISDLIDEDNQEVYLNEIVGPCGSRKCTMAEVIQNIIRHEGAFAAGATQKGLSTQCDCIKKMRDAVTKPKTSCDPKCEKECSENNEEEDNCAGPGCPFQNESQDLSVCYFTVEYDFEKKQSSSSSLSGPIASENEHHNSSYVVMHQANCSSNSNEDFSDNAQTSTFDVSNIKGPCGRSSCTVAMRLREYIYDLAEEDNLEIDLNEIVGPCGSRDCTVAQNIRNIIRHEGAYTDGNNCHDFNTQCHCLDSMKTITINRDNECMDSSERTETNKKLPIKSDSRVFNVYYFTVEVDHSEPNSSTNSPTNVSTDQSDEEVSDEGIKDAVRCCSKRCPHYLLTKKTCNQKSCKGPDNVDEKFSPADSDVIITMDDITNQCTIESCDAGEKVKDFIVAGYEKCKDVIIDRDRCMCDCECTFKFTSNTTYCPVCGGYQCLGQDLRDFPKHALPHPCPIYHNTYNKQILRVPDPWGGDGTATDTKSKPSNKSSSRKNKSANSISNSDSKSDSSRKSGRSKHKKGSKKSKKKDRFAHIQTTITGDVLAQKALALKKVRLKHPTYPNVPKNMGWNYKMLNIHKTWKPGCTHKMLALKYKALKEGGDAIAAKKRLAALRKKKQEPRAAIQIRKKNGEYTVKLEVLKKFSKERLLSQFPFEEKPLIYTVGPTPEEKLKRQRHQERIERREARRINRIIQSTFRNKCQEICLKAYNQAIGVLPPPNPNCPECPCHTQPPRTEEIIDSCSCSDEGSLNTSDTDDDEWLIEFSPPIAKWDVKAKAPPIKTDNETQYTYLDYRVKMYDKQGKPIPRFFLGPDGKEECSDLGGFYGPDALWYEINKDGYIGPDGRWVPMNFVGPDGMHYSAKEGVFTDNSGNIIKIGVDGYVDQNNEWVWYKGKKITPPKLPPPSAGNPDINKTEPMSALKGGKNVKIPTQETALTAKGSMPAPKHQTADKTGHDKLPAKDKIVMNVTNHRDFNRWGQGISFRLPDSSKFESSKLAKYHEILKYDEFGEFRPMTPMEMKSNKASNTLPKPILAKPGKGPLAACCSILMSKMRKTKDKCRPAGCHIGHLCMKSPDKCVSMGTASTD